jgi:hypothetical protein
VVGLTQSQRMLLTLNSVKKSAEIYPSSVSKPEKISRRKKSKLQKRARRANRV